MYVENLPKLLPLPDPIAQAHSQAVFNFICNEIITKGALSFARFMELALYAPGLGYYNAGAQKFGSQGDFITAPEISSLFSSCLARQCQQILSLFNSGDILELGAGTGKMAGDILLELEKLDSLPHHYFILEISADLKERQQKYLKNKIPHLFSRIIWLDSLENFSIQGVILANEVLDAMPVHRFKMESDIKEYFVDIENNELVWRLNLPSSNLLTHIQNLKINFPLGYESEINLQISGWLKTLSLVLQKGLILLIDYGFPRHEYYHLDRSMGTLMCHYRHYVHDNPLLFPGLQDITAHVDFTAVAEAADEIHLHLAGYTTQSNFLFSCGLLEMTSMELDAAKQFKISQEIKRLTLPSEMGELFKVMGLTKNIDFPLLGFNLYDMRVKL